MGYIKRWCFRELRAPAHMKQNVALNILTPFSSKLAKKWEGAAQKTEFDEGVQGGSENYYFMLLVEFCTFFYQCWSKFVCFWGQGIHFSRFWKKYDLLFFQNSKLRQIKPWGRFCACAQNLFKFWCFVNVEWKKPFRSTFWKFEHFTSIRLAMAAIWV